MSSQRRAGESLKLLFWYVGQYLMAFVAAGVLLTCLTLLLQLHFTDDAGEEPVELYHKLKLYGEDDPSGQASTKKPVRAQHKLTTLILMLVKPSSLGAQHVFCTGCLHCL